MSHSHQNPVAGFFLSLVAAAMWGVLPIALKELLTGMEASTVVWYRFLVAGVALFGWLAWRGKLPPLFSTSNRLRALLLIASLGLCGNYYYFSLSLNYVNAETSEAVIQLTTLFLILGGVFFYKEPFTRIQKMGTGLIALGLLLFFNDRLGEFTSLDNGETVGVVIVVVAAVTWTIYALLQKQLLKDFSSVQILFVIYAVSIVVLLPIISPEQIWQLTTLQYALLAFCCLNTILAYGCFAEALNLWDASKVSAMLALAPLFTIGTLKLIVFLNPDYAFSDRLSWLSILGALFLIAGSALTALMPVLYKRRIRQDESARVNAN